MKGRRKNTRTIVHGQYRHETGHSTNLTHRKDTWTSLVPFFLGRAGPLKAPPCLVCRGEVVQDAAERHQPALPRQLGGLALGVVQRAAAQRRLLRRRGQMTVLEVVSECAPPNGLVPPSMVQLFKPIYRQATGLVPDVGGGRARCQRHRSRVRGGERRLQDRRQGQEDEGEEEGGGVRSKVCLGLGGWNLHSLSISCFICPGGVRSEMRQAGETSLGALRGRMQGNRTGLRGQAPYGTWGFRR